MCGPVLPPLDGLWLEARGVDMVREPMAFGERVKGTDFVLCVRREWVGAELRTEAAVC